MQILNTWVTWLAWLQNEPLFELKELSKEEKQHLNCKTEKKKKKTLLKHLINYFPLKKTSFRNSHPYHDSLQR